MIPETKNIKIYKSSQSVSLQLIVLLFLIVMIIELTNFQIAHYTYIINLSLIASLLLSYSSYKTLDENRTKIILKTLFYFSIIVLIFSNLFFLEIMQEYNKIFYSILVGQIILFPFILKKINKKQDEKLPGKKNENIQNQNKKSNKKIIIITVLIFLLLLSFFVRVYNANELSPGRDSLHHYIAAKSINDNGSTVYDTLPYINYMLSFIFKFFSETLLFAKLPFIIVSTLSVLLIYIIGRKISTLVGIISAFLFAICPWAIGLASYVRDYSFNLFFMLTFVAILLYFPKNISNKEGLKKYILLNVIIYIPFIIFAFFQKGITIHIILAMLITTFIRIFAELDLMKKTRKMSMKDINFFANVLIFIIFFAILVVVILGFENRLTLTFQPKWLFFFLSESRLPTLWYSFLYVPWYFIFSLTILPLIGKIRNRYVWISFVTFYSYLIFFVFFAKPNTATLYARYIYPALPFFIILIAVSIEYIISMAGKFSKNKTFQAISIFLVLLFLGTIFNFSNTLYAMSGENSWETDKRQVISDPYFDYYELLLFLREKGFSKEDIIIVSELRAKDTLAWHFDFNFYQGRNATSFNSLVYDIADNMYIIADDNNEVLMRHDEGWIVRRDGDMMPKSISERSKEDVEPTEELKSMGIEIEYLGKYSGKYEVYRWHRND